LLAFSWLSKNTGESEKHSDRMKAENLWACLMAEHISSYFVLYPWPMPLPLNQL
jgi:hypothetical protein